MRPRPRGTGVLIRLQIWQLIAKPFWWIFLAWLWASFGREWEGEFPSGKDLLLGFPCFSLYFFLFVAAIKVRLMSSPLGLRLPPENFAGESYEMTMAEFWGIPLRRRWSELWRWWKSSTRQGGVLRWYHFSELKKDESWLNFDELSSGVPKKVSWRALSDVFVGWIWWSKSYSNFKQKSFVPTFSITINLALAY